MGMRTINNRIYEGINLCSNIRGSIAKSRTFRVRKGTGYIAGDEKDFYQDQYAYFLPTGYATANVGPYRQQWIAAVHKWKFDLTAAQKQEYNVRASKGLRMSGFNLFMREAMKGLVQMYVDRGDPAAYDFDINDFTLDAAWHDLDLSALIPLGAKSVLFDFDFTNSSANRHVALKKGGQTNDFNHVETHTRVAAQDDHSQMVVAVGPNRIIQYNISAAGWSAMNATLCGWWT